VLAPGGSLFVYTHVRQESVLAPLLRMVAATAAAIERLGFADLTIEKLRKTDHLNPLMSRAHLDQVAAEAGFTVEKFRYYTPLLSSIAENILVPVAAPVGQKECAPHDRIIRCDRAAMRSRRLAVRTALPEDSRFALKAITRVIAGRDALRTNALRPFFALL
jgi:hypothetical protein